MKKSFLMLPAMIALFAFAENNNDRINKISFNEYLLNQQDPFETQDARQTGRSVCDQNSKTREEWDDCREDFIISGYPFSEINLICGFEPKS